jgi:hypothetical protein
MPAAFFAGTSFGADRDDLKLIPKSSERRKEGVGETSGQTAGSNFEGRSRRLKPIRQKKQMFLRSVRMAFPSAISRTASPGEIWS